MRSGSAIGSCWTRRGPKRHVVSRIAAVLAGIALSIPAALAGGSLGIPVQDSQGRPIDVGLLILGHSTSVVGDWPGKLASVLNTDAADGRNYVVLRAITNGDGGFLWSQLRFDPGDLQYDRVQSSMSQQFCQDNNGTRWSCRRLALERGITGLQPTPPECAPPNNTCVPPGGITCIWHENGQRFQQITSFTTCWRRMDVHLALVQDTTNRSFAVDDNTGDGRVDENDFFLASDVLPQGRPCGGGTGVIGQWIDWNCDGSIDAGDAAHLRYGEWLGTLADDLLTAFGPDGADHVFFSQKPIEMAGCPYYQGEPCSNHGVRGPTAKRPFDHFYHPTVYWEHRGLDALFARPDLDARIHRATPRNIFRMWERSVQCYDVGIPAADWTIPASAGRPASITADDLENDADSTSTTVVGCLGPDHIHHNESGGWQMADVWYEGLRPYLADVNGPPSGASDGGAGQSPMLVTGYDRSTGLVTLAYDPACHAIDHAVHAGPLGLVGSYAYDRTICGLGTSGSAEIDVGEGSRFWVIAGRDGYVEGSAGRNSAGVERPGPAASGPCYLPRKLGGSCSDP